MIDEEAAIEIGWKAVGHIAGRIEGLDSVRKVSPRLLANELEKRERPSAGLLARLRARNDYWAVNFRWKVPPDEVWCPSVLTVEVDDETGEARIENGL
jgi:hypothetical protein